MRAITLTEEQHDTIFATLSHDLNRLSAEPHISVARDKQKAAEMARIRELRETWYRR